MIPGQGTRFRKPPLRIHMLQQKIPYAAVNTWCSQKKKKAVTLADRRCGDTEQKPLSTKSRDVSQGFGLEAEV